MKNRVEKVSTLTLTKKILDNSKTKCYNKGTKQREVKTMALMNEKNFDKIFSELANMPSIYELETACTHIEYKNNFIIRRVWDIDTGEVYKHQIITLLTNDMALIVEKSALDNYKVVTYTDNLDIVTGTRG